MIATNEELALLEKWKRKLCLQEWRIKLLTHLHPEEMMVRNTTQAVPSGQKQLRPLVLRSLTLPATATALCRSILKRRWYMSCYT